MTFHYLLFDLDDTLYTNASGLFGEVGRLIETWLARELHLSAAEAHALRQHYFEAYGTTMAGLLRDHPELDIDAYLEFAHGADLDAYLSPSPALDAMLARLPLPKAIFTNAIASWAERVLHTLAISHHFEVIVDVRAVDYRGKPAPEAYELALALLDVPGPACILVDDQARNLQAAKEFGMGTILVRAGAEPVAGVDAVVGGILEVEPVIQGWLMKAS
jgi:putative hydrolase of the HAD superfamily